MICIFAIAFWSNMLAQNNLLAYNNLPKEKEDVAIVDEKATVKASTENKYTWHFLSEVPQSCDKKAGTVVCHYDLGQRVAHLKTLVYKYYITKEDAVAGDPMMRTVIRKTEIYFAINKLEKYLKQRVKANSMKPEDASKEMEHILEVALAVIDTDADSFEKTVAINKNKTENLLDIFNRVKLQNI